MIDFNYFTKKWTSHIQAKIMVKKLTSQNEPRPKNKNFLREPYFNCILCQSILLVILDAIESSKIWANLQGMSMEFSDIIKRIIPPNLPKHQQDYHVISMQPLCQKIDVRLTSKISLILAQAIKMMLFYTKSQTFGAIRMNRHKGSLIVGPTTRSWWFGARTD